MNHLSRNKTGLAIGFFYGICHVVWLLMVATGIAKPLLDWVLSLHFVTLSYSVEAFQAGPAAVLIIYAVAMGYLLGWIFAALWNAFNR